MENSDVKRMIDVIKGCSKVIKEEIESDPSKPWDYLIVMVPVNRSGSLPFITSVPEARIEEFLQYLINASGAAERTVEYLDNPVKPS